MEGEQRYFNGKGQEEQPEQPALFVTGQVHFVERCHRKGVICCMKVYIDNTYQHQQRSYKSVYEKLERNGNSSFATPNGAQEVSRYKRQFPEEVEQQSIGSYKH